MDRTWKLYGILVVLAGLLFGGCPYASLSYVPAVPSAFVPFIQSTAPALRDATPPLEQDTGKAYYTGNHYRTFTPLNETP
jgi:hypothetical protein